MDLSHASLARILCPWNSNVSMIPNNWLLPHTILSEPSAMVQGSQVNVSKFPGDYVYVIDKSVLMKYLQLNLLFNIVVKVR